MERILTAYDDVGALLSAFTDVVVREMRDNLVGVYLTGSLTYDAFEYRSSDIDFTVIVERPVSEAELVRIRDLHREMAERFPVWSQRLECTYTPVGMLPSLLPPPEGRPWYWGGTGTLYEDADYGNEWVINRYFLHEYGVALYGPEFGDLAGPVDMLEVQKACVRDLFVEWKPKLHDEEWLEEYGHWPYIVLNLCRILYTVSCAAASSKQVAARWVMETYGERWEELVGGALRWGHGDVFEPSDEALAFLGFVVLEVSGTALYGEVSGGMEGR